MTLRTNLVITRESDGTYKFNYGNLIIYCKDQGGTIKHRINAPAVITKSTEEYYQDNKRHNANGPAIVSKTSENKVYYLFDRRVTKIEHDQFVTEEKAKLFWSDFLAINQDCNVEQN